MARRVLSVVLWFNVGWFVGSVLAYALGQPNVLGPILALAAAGLFAGDPRRIIWVRDTAATATKTQTATPDPA